MSTIAEQVGRVVGGRYRLLAPVGAGASSQVYAAADARLGRQVAVKLLHPMLASDGAFLRRFRAEARLAASLDHPAIMRVFDWGEEAGGPYLVLELLGGGSLRSLLDTGYRLSPSQAAVLGSQAAAGLAYAHRRGIVHRDIKPGNLLFDEDGAVRIADFGVARAMAEAALTEPLGAIFGTARYASPEQAEGRPLDDRTDVYSLALVLYEALTGRVPFGGDTITATLMARVGAILPAARELGPLAPVLAQAAISEPLARLDAALLAADLDELRRELPPPQLLPLERPRTAPDAGRNGGVHGRGGAAGGGGPGRDQADPIELGGPHTALMPAVLGPGTTSGAPAAPGTGVGLPLDAPPEDFFDDLTLAAGFEGREAADGSDASPDVVVASDGDGTDLASLLALGDAPAGTATTAGAEGEHAVPALDLGPEGRRGRLARRGRRHGAAQKRSWLRTLMVVVVVAVVLAGGASAGVILTRSNERKVPALTSLTLYGAETKGHRADLKVRLGGRTPSFTVAEGHVVSQSIKPGTEEHPGALIRVVLSSGRPFVKVVNEENQPGATAIAALEHAHLRPVVTASDYNETVAAGSVILQQPVSGSVRWGSRVSIVESKGPHPRVIPSVGHGDYQSAAASLTAIQLQPVEQPEHSTAWPAGDVIGTSPAEGTTVKRGSPVTVFVSTGPPLVPVPNIYAGETLSAAESALRTVGLVPIVYGIGSTVLTVYPAPDSTLPVGHSVYLYTI